MRSFRERLLGFALLPLLSSVSPFIVLPIVARAAGVEGWAAIGVGQSVGALAAMIVVGGWSLYGPSRVAPVDERERRSLYSESLVGRSFLYLCVIPPIVVANVLLLPAAVAGLGACTSAAFAVAGLSPSWFAIGTGRPQLVARYEVIPRVSGALIAAAMVATTHQVLFYPALMLAGSLVGIALLHGKAGFGRVALRDVRVAVGGLWRARSDFSAVVAAGVYSTIPVTLVGATLAVSDVARYSSADRLYRIGLLAIVALSGALQGWVAERPGERRRRMRLSLIAHVVLGVSGGIGLALAGGPVSALLFGGAVGALPQVMVWYGISFAAVSVNTSTGSHILVPLARSGAVLASTLAGAVTGVTSMLVLLPALGGVGAAAGLAIGEVVVCAVQALALLRLARPRAAAKRHLDLSS